MADKMLECPECPVCGYRTPQLVYRGFYGDIVGCDECLHGIDPWDCPECGGGDER